LERKKKIYIITIVDRATRCFLGYKIVWERTQQVIQDMVDETLKAKHYFSNAFDAYDRLYYHGGRYEVSEGKTDTYSAEGDNAELRHYLAHLGYRSRCFSHCAEALDWAVKLFIYYFNRRQSLKQSFLNYPDHLFQSI
jgi:IS1 family transposase